MSDKQTFWDRLWGFMASKIPRSIAHKCAVLFWAYAFSYVSDEQSDAFLEVLQAGFDHWGQTEEDV